MKVFKVYTASTSEAMARLHCAQWYPFGASWVGYLGFYLEKGWWLVHAKDPYREGDLVCVEISDPQLELYSVVRNIVCIDGVGDILEWGYVDDEQRVWSISRYLGLAVRVSGGCFRLPGELV